MNKSRNPPGLSADTSADTSTEKERLWLLLFVAWLVALVSTLGALFIGEVMGQMPCLLCWYQRIAMFPLAVILMVATFRTDAAAWAYALPLVIAGWLIAAYHTLLYFGFIAKPITPCAQDGPSCSGEGMTLFGLVSIPALSLVAFSLIFILLLLVRKRNVA